MKSRTTLLLLVLTIGLGSYVFLVDKRKPSTRDKELSSQTLSRFDQEQVTGLEITHGETVIKLAKNASGWRLVEPLQDGADLTAITPILVAASNLTRFNILDNLGSGSRLRDAHREYGVHKSKVRLKILGPDMPAEIFLGKDTAVEGKSYARLENDDAVSIIRSDLRGLLTKSISDFRSKRLTSIPSTSVAGVHFQTPAGQIELVEQAGNWNIVTPIKARAANGRILDLISSVNNLTISEFVASDESTLARYGFAQPRGSITFSAREDATRERIEIGAPVENDPAKVYVRVSGRPSLFIVAKNLADALGVKPNDVRDSKLARINEDLVDRITIQAGTSPAFFLQRDGDEWKFADGSPAESTEVERLLGVINNTEATEFVDDTAADLAKYGLEQPQFEIRLSSFSSDNTAEAPKGETPVATLQAGRVEGGKLYLRLVEEPFIVATGPGLISNVGLVVSAYRPLAFSSFDPTTIAELTFQKIGSTPVLATREDGGWKVSVEPPYTNLDSIATKAGNLQAARWLSQPLTDDVFQNAQILGWRTAEGTRRLLLGTLSPDGLTYARFEDDPAIFLLDTETVQALAPTTP